MALCMKLESVQDYLKDRPLAKMVIGANDHLGRWSFGRETR